MNLNSNIVLIGFMGSGKSTVGRILARELNTFFVDSDALIEAREGMDIPSLFEQKGEAYFREQEAACLGWIISSLKGSIVSTGGGLPVHSPGLSEAGTVVFLKSDIDTLIKRIDKDGMAKRPLAEEPEQIQKIYESRLAVYEKLSDLTVDANSTPQQVVDAILKKLFPDRTA